MNKHKAVEYYRMAAEKGDVNATYNLGVCYENGTGVLLNVSEALSWYEKAKAKGHEKAQQAFMRLDKKLTNERQTQKENLSFIIASVVFLIGLVISFSAPDESWLNEDIIGCENGIILFSVLTCLSHWIAKKILGVD